jgi:hypothetical protein
MKMPAFIPTGALAGGLTKIMTYAVIALALNLPMIHRPNILK